MLIIGISGKKGSGKTWMAKRLVELCNQGRILKSHNYHPTEAPLAQALKNWVHRIYPFPHPALYGASEGREKPYGPLSLTGREVLQAVGQSLRDVHPEFWLWQWDREFDKCDIAIVPDVRYKNELAWFIARGAYLIRMKGGDITDTHVSETDLDEVPDDMFDRVFQNPVEARVSYDTVALWWKSQWPKLQRLVTTPLKPYRWQRMGCPECESRL